MLLAVLVVAPLAAAVGLVTSDAEGRMSQEQHASRYQVNAVLTEDALFAPSPVAEAGFLEPRLVLAYWQAPDGTVRTGTVEAGLKARAGSPVPVWTDRAGNLVPPPRTPGDAALFGVLAAAGAAAAGLLALRLTYLIVRRRLDRVRLDSWDDEWSLVGPRWARGLK